MSVNFAGSLEKSLTYLLLDKHLDGVNSDLKAGLTITIGTAQVFLHGGAHIQDDHNGFL